MYVHGMPSTMFYLLCTIDNLQAQGCKSLSHIKEGLSDCTKLRRINLSGSGMVEVCIRYCCG